MSEIVIVGTGAWGTALALQALRAGNSVTLVARDAASADRILSKRENPRLPGATLPDRLAVWGELPDHADLLIWAVPTQHLRLSLRRSRPETVAITVCAKGLEAETGLLPSEVVDHVCPGQGLAILSGPNFALEVARGLPAAAVVASANASIKERVLDALGTQKFRLYGSDDPIGAQLGGAAKNVIAIAAGAVMGAGLGENARAALVTRGLSEMCRLAISLGGRAETIMGLSGLGDLLLTCTGPSSRNYSLGYALGQGRSLAEILATRSSVTEGVPTAAALVARAGLIELPICRAVADFLGGVKTMDETIHQLLSRPQRDE